MPTAPAPRGFRHPAASGCRPRYWQPECNCDPQATNSSSAQRNQRGCICTVPVQYLSYHQEKEPPMNTPAISRRAAILRRSHVRIYVLFMLGDETSSYDVDSLVLELVDMDDSDYQSMGIEQFWTIANRHEYDE